ncbi:membrane fusion protein (multidrug efflux system) [Stenotrophomonas rhizophila]|uniref:Membrane fusion protein (Multidrug efflux system) n=1 Tax=Stenotrophomonas rhizophila TaxID=216778 RepID=A0A498CLU1_9GAMM|nr:efflux RND transporter periplasmic adaptor subunit [Stenotrophomonas rhizophila]RLK57600.1 membrane fusion protein (multidrug efflux system) [Stenotrophomonas rhizophila]
MLQKHLLLPLALAVSIVLSACGGEVEQSQGGPIPVTIATLKAEQVGLTRELPGRTSPFLIAEVRPQVNGIVGKRLFTEGGLVEAGQALYQLDDASYRAQANNARAQLARAEATANASRLSAKRITALAHVDAVSRQDLENAEAAEKQAVADVGAARALLDAANVTLGFARITAPISGRIGKSSVTQGALVSVGQADALATIQQLDPIYVDLTQSASELLQLRREMAAGRLKDNQQTPVTILLEDGTEFPQKGSLEFSEVSVDPTTGSYGLRVKVDNPDQVLMPGMYVRAVIGGGVRDNALMVPMQGIARDAKGETTAMVVRQDNKVEARRVKVSAAIGDKWLVEDGLKAGDKVIVEGLQKIQPGATVQATERGAAPTQSSADGQDAQPTQAPAPAQQQ